MKHVLFLALALALCGTLPAAEPAKDSYTPLWNGKVPYAKGTSTRDIPGYIYVPAQNAKGLTPAIVIYPGGGYSGLAGHEGMGYAKVFAQNGIASFVIRYRLGSAGYRHPVMLTDAARAVRMVRFLAGKYHIDPKKVGVIGSSAGGHLASMIVTQFDSGDPQAADPVDRLSSRPDFGILCYPVITMGKFTHRGSRNNLLGNAPSAEMIDSVSSEKQVKANTPPCFIWHTSDDGAVPVENSLLFATALRTKRIPFELHVYPHGSHGLGFSRKDMVSAMLRWIKER